MQHQDSQRIIQKEIPFVLEKDANFNIPVREGKMGETLFQYLQIGNV